MNIHLSNQSTSTVKPQARTIIRTVRAASCTAILLLASACGWVDSTGNNDSPVDDSTFGVSPATSGASTGQNPDTLIDIPETRIIQLQENTSVRVTPHSLIGDAVDWTWTPVASGNPLLECNRLVDFNGTLAANNLINSCTNSDECGLGIEPAFNTNGKRVFDFNVPQLKSPLALRYRLSGFSPDGNTYNEFYSFCFVSINEAPLAVDDLFTVIRGETLQVRSSDTINLLSNDSDDVDASNLPLRITSTPLVHPRLAEDFSLLTDGGFVYVAPAIGGPTPDFDSFTYQVSDGFHRTTASATIRIVDSNSAPALVTQIPDLTVVVGQTIATDDPSYDLGRFFRDPDGNSLQLSTTAGSLPPSGNLSLSPEGQLSGTITNQDIGDYTVTVIASDGRDTLSDSFTLSIEADPSTSTNQVPVIAALEEIVVNEGQRINAQVEASDADGDTLTYSLSAATADFLSIGSTNGRIRGVAVEAGLFPITVIVSDSVSSTRRTFFLRVIRTENQPPQVDDISNAVFSDAFTYDISVFFTDPDNDVMTFSAINLPAGVDMSPAGIISGTPSASNAGPHFITITADDGNLGTSDDSFLLTLTP